MDEGKRCAISAIYLGDLSRRFVSVIYSRRFISAISLDDLLEDRVLLAHRAHLLRLALLALLLRLTRLPEHD